MNDDEQLFHLIDRTIERYLRRLLRHGQGPRKRERMPYILLAQMSKVKRSIMKQKLGAYVEGRKEGIELERILRFSVSLGEGKDELILTKE